MMHLYVGRVLAEHDARLDDAGAFYLGCIAPDGVNVDGFAEKAVRWQAHLRDADLARWAEKIAAYYREQLGRYPESLLLGYLAHCLTDVVWDAFYHDAVWSAAAQVQGRSSMMGMEPGWEECFRYDYDQLRRPWWFSEVRPALQAARAQAIGGVSREQLERYRLFTVGGYADTIPGGSPRIVRPALVRELSGRVLEKYEELLV